MLLHFKLNCLIFVMLVGQINLGEKVSQNIDAFFDPSVDDLQDNFYDIPFIPEQFQNDISEREIFQYGREKLSPTPPNTKLNEDYEELNRLYKLKDEIIKRSAVDDNVGVDDCLQPQALNTSGTLLDSVVQKFNQIGKEKNSLHLRMQDIEDDEAILENTNHHTYKRLKRNVFDDNIPMPDSNRRHRFINAIHFSHKYRHKKLEDAHIEKRTCPSKLPKMPHKHKDMRTPFQASKHEAFKDELLDADDCNNNKAPEVPDESGCPTTEKHKKSTSPTASSATTTTKKKHKLLAAKTTTKTTRITKKVPPTKPSIKSVLCHKSPKTTTTTQKPNDSEEYEDYKAGDFEDEFRIKRDQIKIETDKKNNGENTIDQFLKEETTKSDKPSHHESSVGIKKHKENAIDQFLKEETTKAASPQVLPCSIVDHRRDLHATETENADEEDELNTSSNEMKSDKIDDFLNSEVPKVKVFEFSSSLKKHKQYIAKTEEPPKKDKSNNFKRTAYLTPIFNKDRLYRKRTKDLFTFTTEKMIPSSLFTENYHLEEITTEKYVRSTQRNNLKQKIYMIDPKKDDRDPFEEEDEENTEPPPRVKLKQRVFIVRPKKKHQKQEDQNQNFDNSKKFVVLGDESNKMDSLKHFEDLLVKEDSKKLEEKEIINYLKEIIKNQRQYNINNNQQQQQEKVVNIKEMNKNLALPFAELDKHVLKKKPKIYVAHSKSQGRQHHRIYFEPETTKKKTNKQKISSTTQSSISIRNFREDSSSSTETLSKYEKFLERLKNKEVTTNKIKYQIDEDEETEETDDIDEETTEMSEIIPETTEMEDNPEIDELYSEIPVNRKRIQLTLNCNQNDYKNKDHCICSVTTMLRDLMDDLKDINSSINYQYDCSKYISIEPGIVIANDSRKLRNKRYISSDNNFMLRKGSRIGRDVDGLLNEHLNVDDSDNYIYAIVGSKVVLNCGNVPEDYNDDDKIVWTIKHGAPETAGIKEDNGRELVIERVSAQDTNNYTCAISHKLEDGTYGPTKQFQHKLSIVEIPIYSLMITVIFNESARCEEQDLETLHTYYPLMLKKFLCSGQEEICHVSVDKPHCTRSHSDNGVQLHATLKTLPLYTILPSLRNKQHICGISCQSRVYSTIVRTLENNFASVTNLPVACEPQTYNPGNKKTCLDCPSGSYQPNYGAGSCLPCTSPLDDARCLFGSKAELAPKLYFIIPIILVLIIIIIILWCIYSSTRKRKTDETTYAAGDGEVVQTKVIEQIFTGDPSEKSYSTAATTRKSEKKHKKSKTAPPPAPPPVDFN